MNKTINSMQVRESTSHIIRDPINTYSECKDMSSLAQEAFVVLTLNTRSKLIARHLVSLGLADSTLVHPREVFRPAISDGASAIILVHNHPTGETTPSMEDIRVTRQLIDASKIIGIKVTDHLIIGPNSERPFLSLRESGIVQF